VSDAIVLRARDGRSSPAVVERLTADHLATLSEHDIAQLPAAHGRQRCRLGDLFDVRGGHSAQVRLEGALDLIEGLGDGMAGGELVLEGSAGARVGIGMSGGRIEVRGNVGDDAGVAMTGGTLHVRGSAGDRLGAMRPGASRGMSGGEIVVDGSAGSDAGARARRGLIVVGGGAGPAAARHMIAGSIVVFGRIDDGAGMGNKRGTLVAIGGITVPPGYAYACTFTPPHLLLTLRYLQRRFGIAMDERVLRGRFRRYCGDIGQPGKGEILEWVSA
jgi:formylmethanofuran dehydrogenase subunit C